MYRKALESNYFYRHKNVYFNYRSPASKSNEILSLYSIKVKINLKASTINTISGRHLMQTNKYISPCWQQIIEQCTDTNFRICVLQISKLAQAYNAVQAYLELCTVTRLLPSQHQQKLKRSLVEDNIKQSGGEW